MQILIIEDEKEIYESIRKSFETQGISTKHAIDNNMADFYLMQNTFDLAILDLGLPNTNIEFLLKRLHGFFKLPILILTARHEVESKIQTLNLGADDYMTKPFEQQELLARVYAVLRRTNPELLKNKPINFGNLRLIESEKSIYVGLEKLDLSLREYSVLCLLIQKNNTIVSKKRLQDFIAKEYDDLVISETAIEVYIHRVRKKIQGFSVDITTHRGFGYKLEKHNNDN